MVTVTSTTHVKFKDIAAVVYGEALKMTDCYRMLHHLCDNKQLITGLGDLINYSEQVILMGWGLYTNLISRYWS